MELWLSVAPPGGLPRDVAVDVQAAHRVGDLTSALARHFGLHPPTGADRRLVRAGRDLDPDSTIADSGLSTADELHIDPGPGETSREPRRLAVRGGPRTGDSWPLRPGPFTLGRDETCDIVLRDAFTSRRHLELVVKPDGRAVVTDLGSSNGTLVEGDAITRRDDVTRGMAIEVGSCLLTLMDLEKAPEQIDIAALSEDRDASVRGATRAVSRRRTQIDPVVVRDRLNARHPTLDTLYERVETRAARTDRVVRIGFGDREVIVDDTPTNIPGAPLLLDLDDVANVTLAGPDPDGLARAVIAQLVVAHTPDELAIAAALGVKRKGDWAHAAWLPHTRRGGLDEVGGPPRMIAWDVGEAAQLIRSFRAMVALRARRGAGRRFILILDAGLPWGRADLPTSDELQRAGVLVIWLGSPEHTSELHVVPSGEDGSVTIVSPDNVQHGNGADHLTRVAARKIALAVARRDATTGDRLPSMVELDELGWTTDDLLSAWHKPTEHLGMRLGADDRGPTWIEMSPTAPHLAVAGDNSTGRSTVLRTAAITLMANHPPSELGIVFVGTQLGTLGALANLPHVAGVVIDPAEAGFVRSVEAEIRSRRELLSATGARSIQALRAAGGDTPPRLVVLADDLRGADLDSLDVILDGGADVDVHLVFVLTDGQARSRLASIGNRLHLRTTDAASSVDLLGTAAALSLPTDRVGRGMFVAGDGGARPLQLASAGVARQAADEIIVHDLEAGRPVAGGQTWVQRKPADDRKAVAEFAANVASCATDPAFRRDWGVWLDGGTSDARTRRTLMFTDIVGSTDLVAVIGDRAWTRLLHWHDEMLRSCFERHGGEEVDHAGDGFFVAFPDPASGVECAMDIQRRLDDHRQDAGFAPQVRIGVHEVDAVVEGNRYTGHGVHEAARVGAIAEGDEIVASLATAKLAGVGTYRPRPVELKGVPQPMDVVSIRWQR